MSGTFQVIDAMYFHEYAIVDKVIYKVTPWLPPERLPWQPGKYQCLYRKFNGELVVREYHWDGKRWTSLKSGYRSKARFYWRGLSGNPELANADEDASSSAKATGDHRGGLLTSPTGYYDRDDS